MLRIFFIFLFILILNEHSSAFNKNSLYFGIEGNSIKNYFAIDLLPVNFENSNLFTLSPCLKNKYYHEEADENMYDLISCPLTKKNKVEKWLNEYGELYIEKKIIPKQRILNITNHFLSYLKEIKTSDFVFTNGISLFVGYKINNNLSINFGIGSGYSTVHVKLNDFNELLKHKFVKNIIGKYKYSYETKWIDLFKTLTIEKNFMLLFSFGVEYSNSKFQFLSNRMHELSFINGDLSKQFDIKKYDSKYLLKAQEDIIEQNLIPYTNVYQNDNEIIDKEHLKVIYSKISMDKLFNSEYYSNKRGIRFGVGAKCVITNNLYINFLFRYHVFFNEYKYIKFLDKHLFSTNLGFIYKF